MNTNFNFKRKTHCNISLHNILEPKFPFVGTKYSKINKLMFHVQHSSRYSSFIFHASACSPKISTTLILSSNPTSLMRVPNMLPEDFNLKTFPSLIALRQKKYLFCTFPPTKDSSYLILFSMR